MPKKTKLTNRPIWFKPENYETPLSFENWLHELRIRWELFEQIKNPNFKITEYDESQGIFGRYNYVWEMIKKYGYYTKSDMAITKKFNNGNISKIPPINLPNQTTENNFGLENPNINSLRFYELCLLTQALEDDISELNLSNPGFIYTKDKGYYPDLNVLVSDMFEESNQTFEKGVHKHIGNQDRIKQLQFISVDLNTSNQELIKQFKVWLSHARKKYYNQTPYVSGDRLEKLKKALNLKSGSDLSKLKEQSDTYKVIPYLDLKFYLENEDLSITQQKFATDICVEISSFKKYTQKLSESLIDPDILSHLYKLNKKQ